MRVAVIEDEKPIRLGLVNILNKISPDCEVVGNAADGKEGLKLLKQEQPDLVLLDIQMPDMNGLEMLKKARECGIQAKVIILTAYSDFSYAKEAISQGIENYLLKPVNLQELKQTIEKIREELIIEQRGKHALTLEQLFSEAIEGKLSEDDETEQILEKAYGITAEEKICCLSLYLGNDFKTERKEAEQFLKELAEHSTSEKICWIEEEGQNSFFICFYHVDQEEKLVKYIKNSVLPACLVRTNNHGIFTWESCHGMYELKNIVTKLEKTREWNLIFDSGVLIECKKLSHIRINPFVYPSEIEGRAKHAVIYSEMEEFTVSYQQFMNYCLMEVHDPKAIREACIRFAYAVISTAKECGSLKDENLLTQSAMKSILKAVSWEEIMQLLMDLFAKVAAQEENTATVPIVQRALSIVKECYADGITLEEIARRMHVSETYLSKILKKETNMNFTEIMKRQRIDQMKKLLLDTDLKLNQIAAMTGFSDPKYMSKVFKNDVGVLPNEYRKFLL